ITNLTFDKTSHYLCKVNDSDRKTVMSPYFRDVRMTVEDSVNCEVLCRDHEYPNPLQDKNISGNGKITQLPKCLVIGYSGDPLVDRQRAFANMLEACGVQVIKKFDNEGYHIVEFFDPQKAKVLYDDIKSFISSLEKMSSL
nr:probable carboxylesterase 8 [Tanacetum cinerariifolium]